MSLGIEMAVQTQPSNPYHHLHEELYRRLDQIEDLRKPQHDLNEVHCRALVEYS